MTLGQELICDNGWTPPKRIYHIRDGQTIEQAVIWPMVGKVAKSKCANVNWP